MTAAAARMLRAMDRAVALWSIPVIGKEKGRILRRLIDKHAPLLRGPVDLLLLDAKKDDYLDYLRAVEPRLTRGALVVADNTGVFRREVRPYLAHVRGSGRYDSREHDLGFDCMEVSVYGG
jgi:predicted O-methyltransferase YrrM